MSELTRPDKINLLGLDRKAMEAFCLSLGEKSYRATQILKWIHFQGVNDIHAMSNISKALREKISNVAEIRAPEIAYESTCADGTQKWIHFSLMTSSGRFNPINYLHLESDSQCYRH